MQLQHIAMMFHANLPRRTLKTGQITSEAHLVMWAKQGAHKEVLPTRMCPLKEMLDIITAGGDALRMSLMQFHASPEVNSSVGCGWL